MGKMMKLGAMVIVAGSLVAAVGGPAGAQTLQDALRQQLQERLKERPQNQRLKMDPAERRLQSERDRLGRNPEQSKARYLGSFFQIAPDGVLTRDGVELNRMQRMAAQRANQMMQFMQLDLDGDAKISDEEFAIGPMRNNTRARAQAEMLRLTGDLDGDGFVNAPEMVEFARKQMANGNGFDRFTDPALEIMLEFDADGDGKVTSEEVLAGIDALAAKAPKRP